MEENIKFKKIFGKKKKNQLRSASIVMNEACFGGKFSNKFPKSGQWQVDVRKLFCQIQLVKWVW